MVYPTQVFQGKIDPKLLRRAMLRVYFALKVLRGINHLPFQPFTFEILNTWRISNHQVQNSVAFMGGCSWTSGGP